MKATTSPGCIVWLLLASLAGPGFEITRTLGVAAFAPELRLPVALDGPLGRSLGLGLGGDAGAGPRWPPRFDLP